MPKEKTIKLYCCGTNWDTEMRHQDYPSPLEVFTNIKALKMYLGRSLERMRDLLSRVKGE